MVVVVLQVVLVEILEAVAAAVGLLEMALKEPMVVMLDLVSLMAVMVAQT
jgi:hypothetical protein